MIFNRGGQEKEAEMPSEEDKKVVKLASMSKELKVLSQMNYSLRKKNNEQKGQIALLQ